MKSKVKIIRESSKLVDKTEDTSLYEGKEKAIEYIEENRRI